MVNFSNFATYLFGLLVVVCDRMKKWEIQNSIFYLHFLIFNLIVGRFLQGRDQFGRGHVAILHQYSMPDDFHILDGFVFSVFLVGAFPMYRKDYGASLLVSRRKRQV